MNALLSRREVRWTVLIALVVLSAGLRVYRLDTDAYPGLSWDTGLFTDEGFYLHNARNVLLFGAAKTDEFNNLYLMPVLHSVQVFWFQRFGVGSLQTRSLSILLSLFTLPFYFDALRRLFGKRTAALATLFLSLDHLNLLYNRMGLMDTPAAFGLVGAFWFFSHAVSGEELADDKAKRRACAMVCGTAFGLCYALRGLTLCAAPAFLAAFWKRPHPASNKLCPFIIGLFLFLVVFAGVWYLPNRSEIARINAFHLKEQLLPRTFHQLGLNLWQAVAGVRFLGLLPYLVLHSPLLLILTLKGLFQPLASARQSDSEARGVLLLRLWIAGFWGLCAISNYAPSRYYVLFYPAMMALAAHQLIAFTAFPDRGRGTLQTAFKPDFVSRLLVFVGIWGIVNGCWLSHWLSSLKTTRRDAELWLETHLPESTVLIGDCAPGLALDSKFRVLNVQPGLCNDQDTLAKLVKYPRAVVILDGVWKEKWWRQHYPQAVSERRRAALFHPLISHTVGVYLVSKGEQVKDEGR